MTEPLLAAAGTASATYHSLDAWQVGIAASLILVNGLISILLGLKLEWRLALAAVRTIVQLWLIGQVLYWIFAPDRAWYVVLAMMSLMTIIAGWAAAGRVQRRYRGLWFDSLVSMWTGSWLVTAVALLGVVRNDPWYQPQYAIPLLGMVLGNTLNGISLGLDRLTGSLARDRDRIETLLALGATRWEAARDSIREAVRTGMIPIINSMMVVGLVSLPGMMTGQLLSGVDPRDAVRYQIAIMFLIAAGTALGTIGAVLQGYRRMFNADHQFLPTNIRGVR